MQLQVNNTWLNFCKNIKSRLVSYERAFFVSLTPALSIGEGGKILD
jgi:hypothetical protein